MKQTTFLLLFPLIIFTSGSLWSQERSFTISSESPWEVYVSGTSTLHDWKATVGKVIDFPANLKIDPVKGGTIEKFGFKAEGKSMDGGRGSTMNDKIYKAVKCDVYPYITYLQSKPAKLQPVSGGQFKLVSTGTVMIAGVDQEVNVDVTGSFKDGKLTFEGEYPLKLSDFNIEPPTALFGQIETANDIAVHFTFTYLAQ